MDQSNIQTSILALFKDPYLSQHNQLFIDNRIVRKPELFQSILIMLQDKQLSECDILYGYEILLKYLGEASTVQQMVLIQSQYDNILDRIIHMFLEENTPDIQSKQIELLEWFLNGICLTKRNYRTIFTYASSKLYANDMPVQSVQKILLLIHRVFEERKHLIMSPNSTFYFNHMSSGIEVDTREMRWMFQKGLTLQMWLNPKNTHSNNNQAILMHLLSNNKTGCQLMLSGNKLIYQQIDQSKSQPEATISLLEVPFEEWSMLCIQIQSQRFFLTESYYIYISCNGQSLREIKVDFPNLTPESKVLELLFLVNFYGYVSSLLLFNEGFGGNAIMCGDIRFGIQSNAHLRTLSKSLDKYASKLLLCYTPLRTKANFIIDPIYKFDGALQQHCGAYVKQTVYQHLNQFCRISNFVPLLQFLEFTPYPELLNTLLELFTKILKNRLESQQDAIKIELFSIIALKINDNALSSINSYTIEILSQLKNCLLEKKLKEQFIYDFLWRISIYKVDNFEIIDDYLKFLRMVYNSNPEFYIKVFGIRNILEIIVFDIDPKNRVCCQEHSSQMGFPAYEFQGIPYKQQMEPYFNIIEAVLFYQFFDSTQQLDQQGLIEIARIFTQKCSPCFYQSLLQRIQKLFYYEKVGHHPISQVFIQQDVMQMLLNLLTTCSCPDVKTSCIKLIAESIRLNQCEHEKEIANWIAHTLGNSAAIEVISDDDEESSIPESPIVNVAMLFHVHNQESNPVVQSQTHQTPEKQHKHQIIEQTPKRVIDYEPLYVAIMEWMLKTRVGKNNSDTFILEESFVIRSEGGLQLLMSYISFCVDQVKGRIMQDLCMLVKWNASSAQFLLNNDGFHWWIMEQILDMQHEYNTRELTQFENWVWDSSLKLYSSVLKYGILNDKNGFARVAQLQAYVKVLEKPNRQLASQLTIRFLMKYLLMGLNDGYRSDLNSQFWVNVYSLVFEVFRLTTSDPHVVQQQNEFVFQKFNRLANNLSIVTDLPKKWKSSFGNMQWIDGIFTTHIIDIVNQFSNKLNPQMLGPLEDFQIVQKGIMTQLEYKNHQENTKLFEVLLFQYNFGQQQLQTPCFVQVCQLFLQLAAEYYALNLENSEHLKLLANILSTLERIIRVLIVAAENAREKDLEEWHERTVYQVMASHFNFLFQLQRRVESLHYDHEIKADLFNTISQCLMYSFKFLVIMIDVDTNMIGKFESFQLIIFEANKPSGVPPLKLFVARLLKDLYRANGTTLFDVKETTSLKLNNKLILQRAQQARDVFLETLSVVEMVEQLYFVTEEYYLLMKVDYEDIGRIFEQKQKAIATKQSQQRQSYEEVLFELMQKNYLLDEKIQKIDTEQLYLRRARYNYKKALNSVRVFNQWWTHPQFEAQNDILYDANHWEYENINSNKIFIWKMWKYETKQKCRPLLKPKLLDDYEQQQYDDVQSSTVNNRQSRIMHLAQHDKPKQQKQKDKKTLMDKINPFQMLFTQKTQPDDVIIPKVQWIKTLTVRLGSLKITNKLLIFYFESISQKETHQSLIKFRVPEDSKLVKEWDLEQIYDLTVRRYIGRWTSLELTLLEGSTLVFNFPSKDSQQFVDKILSLKKTTCIMLKPRVISMKLDPWSILQESKALNKWYTYKITTFEYLMKLNKFSGRSYKDLTQYPVFPWIMNDGEQLGKYRDLTKPMGALGSKERQEVFDQRFNMVDHFNKVPQFHYGSHYSSPAIIFHFLIRLKPFSDGAKELQSGRFDLADRLFFSFVDAYKNAVEELSDVRELIPEFYFLPEMFVNLSKYDYGVQQTGQRVNNVELPGWSLQNPYRFICGHRMELESDYVSQNINQWVDLIFGYKQKGNEAVINRNTFYYLTYDNAIDWDVMANEKLRVSLESQVIHFGQCPSQIFDHQHPPRSKLKPQYRLIDEKAHFSLFRQKPQDGSAVNKALAGNFTRSRAIIRIQFMSENKVWLCRRNGEINQLKLNSQVSEKQNSYEIQWEKEQQVLLDRLQDENTYLFDWTCWFDEIPVLMKGKYILVGGVWDGRLLLFSESDRFIESYDEQDSTITVIRTDQKQRVLATGSKSGQLCIYQFGNQRLLKLICKHYHHEGPILDIYICHDLRVVVTSSTDGWVHMYNMWSGKYLRSYKHPKGHPVQKVCVFCTPLYGIVMYEHKTIYSYSINGQLLTQIDIPQTIVNQGQLKVVKDSLLTDIIMIPLSMDKKILLVAAPFLIIRSEIKLTPHIQSMNDITAFALSPDRKILAVGTSDGEFGLVVDLRSII